MTIHTSTSREAPTGVRQSDSNAGRSGPEAELREGKQHAEAEFDAARERAKELGSRVRDEAMRAGEVGRKRVADRLRKLSDAAEDDRERAEDADAEGSSAIERGAGSISAGLADAADYLERNDAGSITRDVAGVARRHPAVVVGGLALAGFALGRFLTARPERGEEGHAHGMDDHNRYDDERLRATSRRAATSAPAPARSARGEPGYIPGRTPGDAASRDPGRDPGHDLDHGLGKEPLTREPSGTGATGIASAATEPRRTTSSSEFDHDDNR